MCAAQPFAFISYRRQDSSAASRWLGDVIRRIFGTQSVFVDTDAIRIGTTWPTEIEDALSRATVLIAVIGPAWLRLADEYGMRRLDNPNDWVRNEIKIALERKIPVIPLIISDATLPKSEGLPDDIRGLTSFQGYQLRDDAWEGDVDRLIKALKEQLRFEAVNTSAKLPRGPRVTIKELTSEELKARLATTPGWKAVTSHPSGSEHLTRNELRAVFEFRSFDEAIAFMAEAAPQMNRINHHPRWENTWKTVTVWLTTWDIGSKISDLDFEVARYLDALYASKYARTKTGPSAAA